MHLRLALCAVLAVATDAAAGPLDKPAFSATPDELLAEAKAAGGDAPVTILADDTQISFDDAGRETIRFRAIVTFRANANALAGWGNAGGEWSPAFQDKAKLRARVIAPDKTVAELDPSLQSEAPVIEFAERMHLAVPLPKIVVGSDKVVIGAAPHSYDFAQRNLKRM